MKNIFRILFQKDKKNYFFTKKKNKMKFFLKKIKKNFFFKKNFIFFSPSVDQAAVAEERS